MAVLDALNWPVLECPQLAGFEVSPEAEDGAGTSGTHIS
jgi:hypothetical protein